MHRFTHPEDVLMAAQGGKPVWKSTLTPEEQVGMHVVPFTKEIEDRGKMFLEQSRIAAGGAPPTIGTPKMPSPKTFPELSAKLSTEMQPHLTNINPVTGMGVTGAVQMWGSMLSGVGGIVKSKAEEVLHSPRMTSTFSPEAFEATSTATGGYIKSTGLVKLHAGERVLSEADVDRGSSGGDVHVNLTINNPLFTNSAEMYKFDQHIREVINRENLCHMTNKRGRGMIA